MTDSPDLNMDTGNPSPSSGVRVWLWVTLVVLIATAVVVRVLLTRTDEGERVVIEVTGPLTPTLSVISDRLNTLDARVGSDEQLAQILSGSDDRTVDESGAGEVAKIAYERFVPLLWTTGMKIEIDPDTLSASSLSEAIGLELPIDDPAASSSGSAVLYTDSIALRTEVPIKIADDLMAAGYPYIWIARFIGDATDDEQRLLKNLSPGALDKIARALAIAAAGLPRLAAKNVPGAGDVLGSSRIKDGFRLIAAERAPGRVAKSRIVGPDEVERAELIASLPDELFREVSDTVGPAFQHEPDPALQSARAELDVPLGVAGGGAAAVDIDGDGYVDLYLAGANGGRLFMNRGGKSFADVTGSVFGAAADRSAETRAGYFIDFDNDGDADLFTTTVAHPNRLYRNDGGVFIDVTTDVGLPLDDNISHEAVFADINNDGQLDIFVANFGQWTEKRWPTIGSDANTNARPNQLFVQRVAADGARRFEDITRSAGVADTGWTHCVGAIDFDGDGLVDLFSLNDFGPTRVYKNLGNERFGEIAHIVGLGLDALYNAMNFALIDFDGSGHPAIYVTQIMDIGNPETKPALRQDPLTVPNRLGRDSLLRTVTNRLFSYNPAAGSYSDVHSVRIEPLDLGWGWDASPIDYDNDSDADLLVLNGTEAERDMPTAQGPRVKHYTDGRTFMGMFANERNAWLVNHNGYLFDMSDRVPLTFVGNSRASVCLDYDNDGDLDVLITGYREPARLFENLQNSGNHYLRIKLIGTESNRDGIGAAIKVVAGGHTQHGWVTTNAGFLSQDPLVRHFGLGTAESAQQVTITWPSGTVQTLANLAADQTHTITEPTP